MLLCNLVGMTWWWLTFVTAVNGLITTCHELTYNLWWIIFPYIFCRFLHLYAFNRATRPSLSAHQYKLNHMADLILMSMLFLSLNTKISWVSTKIVNAKKRKPIKKVNIDWLIVRFTIFSNGFECCKRATIGKNNHNWTMHRNKSSEFTANRLFRGSSRNQCGSIEQSQNSYAIETRSLWNNIAGINLGRTKYFATDFG